MRRERPGTVHRFPGRHRPALWLWRGQPNDSTSAGSIADDPDVQTGREAARMLATSGGAVLVLGATALGLTGALGLQCSGGAMTTVIPAQPRIALQGTSAENSSCDTSGIQENAHVSIKQLSLQRLSITSANSFEAVVATFEAAVGHPNMADFGRQMRATKTYAEMEAVVKGALGPSGFMEFARYDLGAVMRKEQQHAAPKSVRFVIGNPLIMKEMVKRVPDAGSYAPVTILIDDRPDGVHLTYDKMESLLSPYGDPEALQVARELDSKVESLLAEVAR